MANKDGNVSEKTVFTTGTLKEAKKISKTLFIIYEAPLVASNDAADERGGKKGKKGKKGKGEKGNEEQIVFKYDGIAGDKECGKLGTYSKHFTYNRHDMTIQEECWNRFISYLVEFAKVKPKMTVFVDGSASRVPRRARGGNKALAKLRANNMESEIKKLNKYKMIKKLGQGLSGTVYLIEDIIYPLISLQHLSFSLFQKCKN